MGQRRVSGFPFICFHVEILGYVSFERVEGMPHFGLIAEPVIRQKKKVADFQTFDIMWLHQY